MLLNCDGSGGGSELYEDGSFTVSVGSSSATSCLLEIRLWRGGSMVVLFRRTVAIVDGVGSADFQVPPLLKVNFVDPSGEPIFAVGILNAFEDEVIMPDGGVSHVFTSEFMIPTGPSVESSRCVTAKRSSHRGYTWGTEYWGSINTIGADEITFDLSTGIMSVGGPDTPSRTPMATAFSMPSTSTVGPEHHPAYSAMPTSTAPSCRYRPAGRYSSLTNPIPMASGSRWRASPGSRE